MLILLLVQEKSNKSIQRLTQALESVLLHDNINNQLFVWEINEIQLYKDPISLEAWVISNGETSIAIQDITLAMKRTWGPIRAEGLAICKILEDAGVSIVNGCDMIEWTHSKIDQYLELKLGGNSSIFPNSVVFDRYSIEFLEKSSIDEGVDLADALLEAILKEASKDVSSDFSFPMVLKKDRGCKADGVYLIDSPESFKDLISKDFESISKGFLLQSFVRPIDYNNISTYFRLNIIQGKIQSAVQFQLLWKSMEGCRALKLSDFEGAEDKPVDLSIFPEDTLNQIISSCLYFQEVIGIDVMLSEGQLFLLEYNDGPAISVIADLGEKFLPLSENADQTKSAQACIDFANSIAKFCLKKAKSLSPDFEVIEVDLLHGYYAKRDLDEHKGFNLNSVNLDPTIEEQEDKNKTISPPTFG